MNFKFERFIKDEIVIKQIDKYFKEKEIKVPKEITSKTHFFEECVNASETKLDLQIAEELIYNSIKYGARRFLFICKFEKRSQLKLSNADFLLRSIKKIDSSITTLDKINTLNSEQTNKITDFNTDIIEYLSVDKNKDGKVAKLELCITNLSRKNAEDSSTYIKNFYWIELNIDKNIAIFRIPSSGYIFGKALDSHQAFAKYYEILKRDFEIEFQVMTDYSETLYDVAKDIFKIAEKPFTERFAEADKNLSRITEFVHSSKLFKNAGSHSIFNERLKDLLERVIIQENFDEYMGYTEGKNGIITKLEFVDPTGASVRANAGSKNEDTLELCDIFFDTRKTLSEESRINQLIIDWFLPEEIEIADKVNCRFFVGTRYLGMNFQYIKLSEEVEEYVFSNLKGYEGFDWYF